MTPAQIEQRKQAGKSAYRAMVRRSIQAFPSNLDRAAQHLTGARKGCGFRIHKGITRAYMVRWARELGIEIQETGEKND